MRGRSSAFTVVVACLTLLSASCGKSLDEAVVAGDVERARKLLDAGGDADMPVGNGSLLHVAAGRGDTEMIELLVSRGAAVNALDGRGATPLCAAARRDQTEAVRLLLEEGGDPDLRGERGISAFGEASHRGQKEMLRLMLDAGAEIDAPTSWTGYTAWQVARNRECADFLREWGAATPESDPAAWDLKLHEAVRQGDRRTAWTYVKYEAVREAEERGGWPALRLAVAAGHVDVVELLLEYRADPNGCGPDGVTPLHVAAREGSTDAASLLLRRGANADARDAEGRTPLDYATAAGQRVVAELLRSHAGRE